MTELPVRPLMADYIMILKVIDIGEITMMESIIYTINLCTMIKHLNLIKFELFTYIHRN